jgi:hypothetical protein
MVNEKILNFKNPRLSRFLTNISMSITVHLRRPTIGGYSNINQCLPFPHSGSLITSYSPQIADTQAFCTRRPINVITVVIDTMTFFTFLLGERLCIL